MVVFKISMELFGDNFDPDILIKENEQCLGKVIDIIHSKDIKNKRGETYGFGSMTIEHINKYGFSDNLIEYEQWFISCLEDNKSLFEKANIENIWLVIDVYYVDFCSIEVFDKNSLKRLSKFNISIPMNVYKVSKKEIYEMLKEEGFDDKSMTELEYSF